MVEVVCVICGKHFTAKRKSKKCCSNECNRKYINIQHKNYRINNPDKYDLHRFKVSDKNIKKQMERQKYGENITDIDYIYCANPSHARYICDGCGHNFSFQYEIAPVYRDGKKTGEVNHQWNITPWGAPVCPVCGLVGEYPDIDRLCDIELKTNPPRVLSKADGLDWWAKIRFTKYPPIPKSDTAKITGRMVESHYITEEEIFKPIHKDELHDFGVDLIQEAIEVRRMLNKAKGKKEYKNDSEILSKNEIAAILKAINKG